MIPYDCRKQQHRTRFKLGDFSELPVHWKDMIPYWRNSIGPRRDFFSVEKESLKARTIPRQQAKRAHAMSVRCRATSEAVDIKTDLAPRARSHRTDSHPCWRWSICSSVTHRRLAANTETDHHGRSLNAHHTAVLRVVPECTSIYI